MLTRLITCDGGIKQHVLKSGVGYFVGWLRWVCKWEWRHFWHTSLVVWALSSSRYGSYFLPCYIASWMLCVCSLFFYFLLFIMNGSWLDVLGVAIPAPLLVHPCQHVEVSSLEVNPFITLLPIRNVLILNRGYWSDWMNIFVHVVSSWSSLFTVCFGLCWLVSSFETSRDSSDMRLVTLDTCWSLQLLWLPGNRLFFFSFVWIFGLIFAFSFTFSLSFELDFGLIRLLFGSCLSVNMYYFWWIFVNSASRLR